eukprot:1932434-Alexandrium_andersonii.AAC.1
MQSPRPQPTMGPPCKQWWLGLDHTTSRPWGRSAGPARAQREQPRPACDAVRSVCLLYTSPSPRD